ncbi:hypothetical protein EJ110_NYTH59235 [Nymphaea thermarum]|nr:hypothetical protein EJ110_NYTH59235 [Nymphaea thermarum]
MAKRGHLTDESGERGSTGVAEADGNHHLSLGEYLVLGYRVWIWTRTLGRGYRGGSSHEIDSLHLPSLRCRRGFLHCHRLADAPPPSGLPALPPSDVLAPPVSCSLCLSATVGGSCSRRRRLVPATAAASGSASYVRFRFISMHLVVARLLVMAEEMAGAPKSENLPVQVTSIRLTKDNYLSWSAALEIGITSRGRLPYITGDKPTPNKSDPQWATWALEDSQVKVWIISSVSGDIQPLILQKPTSFDMWTVLARMYGRKKRVLRTYQIKCSIYSLTQGDLSVVAFYAALKTKWEELEYLLDPGEGSSAARFGGFVTVSGPDPTSPALRL